MLYKRIKRQGSDIKRSFSTRDINYGNRFSSFTPKHAELYNGFLKLSEKYNAPLGYFFEINNAIHSHSANEITLTSINVNYMMPVLLLEQTVRFCHQIKVHDDTLQSTFWEFLYETVRKGEFKNSPSRLSSYFTCETINDVKKFIATHNFSGSIYQVDACDCEVKFRADMTLLDKITKDHTLDESWDFIQRYWKQEMSATPLPEILLQGTIKVGEKIA